MLGPLQRPPRGTALVSAVGVVRALWSWPAAAAARRRCRLLEGAVRNAVDLRICNIVGRN